MVVKKHKPEKKRILFLRKRIKTANSIEVLR